VADITEFMTGVGKLFLAGVRDLCGRGLVGWSMGTRQTSELVIEAVSMAVARRDPDEDLVHHSDKGCQGEFKVISNGRRNTSIMEVRDGDHAGAPARGSALSGSDPLARAADGRMA
jgi:hypothetical protein